LARQRGADDDKRHRPRLKHTAAYARQLAEKRKTLLRRALRQPYGWALPAPTSQPTDPRARKPANRRLMDRANPYAAALVCSGSADLLGDASLRRGGVIRAWRDGGQERTGMSVRAPFR